MISPIGIAGTGMRAAIDWVTAIADNVANAGDEATPGTPGYQPQGVLAAPAVGGGVVATLVTTGTRTGGGVLVQDPSSPVAGSTGYVQVPDVDPVGQMAGLIMASDSVALNAAVIARALRAYRSALDIDDHERPAE